MTGLAELTDARYFADALEQHLADDYLAVQYKAFMYGGWGLRDRWVSRPHQGLIDFHDAAASLFCPVCTVCGQHYNHVDECSDGGAHTICWRPVGLAPVRAEVGGEGEDAVRTCELHGSWPWRSCAMHTTLALFPGNKFSLGAETRVWTDSGWQRIDEIEGPTQVAAWDGSRWVMAPATQHITKGVHLLHRVTTASGRSFSATAGHRVMRADGRWCRVDELSAGDELLASAVGPPRSSEARAPSVHAASDRRYRRRAGGSPGGCPVCRRSCDERPLHVAGSAQGAPPSPAGAPAHTRRRCACCGSVSVGGRTPGGASTRGPMYALLSSGHVLLRALAPGAGIGSPCASAPRSCGPPSTRASRPPKRGSDPHLRPTLGSARRSTPASCVVGSSFADPVVSVVPDRTDVHYDLSVPGYENFLAEGFVQHNSKTSGTVAQICADILGYRPWDDRLTAPPGNGRIWMIFVQTFSTSAITTILPLVERYMGSRIKRVFTSSNTISGWQVKPGQPSAGDLIKLASQDQHTGARSTVSPLEGVNPAGIVVDEPIMPDMRASYGRGLVAAMADYGWGREYMGMTFLEGAPQARAHCFNEIFQRAGNRGGDLPEVWVRSGSIHENPALTKEDIRRTVEKWPAWEREAREFGIYTTLKGRILADFAPDVHVWDDAQRDVLLDRDGTPSDWPIYMAVDPHDIRPWVMVWVALSPHGHWHVVREWPNLRMEDVRHYRNAEVDGSFEGYAAVIEQIEASLPGGKDRIVSRIMDPSFGDSEKAGLGETVQSAMTQQGLYFETDLPRQIEAGHARLRELILGSWTPGSPVTEMCKPHFWVSQQCHDTTWALMNYVEDDKKRQTRGTGKPAETGKDRIDVLRYIAVSDPIYFSWKTIGSNMVQQQSDLAADIASSGTI